MIFLALNDDLPNSTPIVKKLSDNKETTLTGNPDLVNPGFDCPPDNPLHLLQGWLTTAELLKASEPRGLVLSTVSKNGIPSSRVVLLKTADETGVIFTSSAESQKGKDIYANPIAAGTLWWRETMQQVNFHGKVTKLAPDISDKIFKERPLEAQAVATVSFQSAIMKDEKILREEVSKLLSQPSSIVRPQTWHAYYITIKSIEFWHGSKNRFHQRLRYDLKNNTWYHHKLQP